MPRYSDEDVTAALRSVAERVGRPPTARAYREHAPADAPSARTIFNRYADADQPWRAALHDAGLDPDPSRHVGSGYGWRDRRRAINYAAAHLGAWPSRYRYRQLYRDHDLAGVLPSSRAIVAAEGDWETAVETAAGYYHALEELVDDGPSIELDADYRNNSFLRTNNLVRAVKLRTNSSGRQSLLFLPGHSPRDVVGEWMRAVDRSALSETKFQTEVTTLQSVFPDADILRLVDHARDD